MFEKLKQFRDLRNQAKTLQAALAQETVTVNRHGVSLTLDGNLKVTALTVDPAVTAQQLQINLAGLLNDAIGQAQRKAAQKMQQMGGLKGLGL